MGQSIGIQQGRHAHDLAAIGGGRDFAEMWWAADKIVHSRSLTEVSTPRTRLERQFDAEAVARKKDDARRDISVGGPALAEHAFAAGPVDHVHLLVYPLVLGGGKPGLPPGAGSISRPGGRAALREWHGPPAPSVSVTVGRCSARRRPPRGRRWVGEPAG